jgi:hypothetical protein
MDYFYFISIPLNQTLVHCGRDTTIGMDPISPKQDDVRALAVDNKKSSRDGLASYHQIHAEDSLRLRSLSIKVT